MRGEKAQSVTVTEGDLRAAIAKATNGKGGDK